MDANTQFCLAIPINVKLDVFAVLTFSVNTEDKSLGYYPNVINLDRGTEFVNTSLEEYCQRNLIRQCYSNAYTPQQNGVGLLWDK